MWSLFFAFRETWQTFSKGLRSALDQFMAENSHASGDSLDTAEEDFVNTVRVVQACFGEHAFSRWVPETGKWRKQINVSVYDALMFACRGRDPGLCQRHRLAILRRMQTLFGDDEFRRSVDRATNTPSFFRARITTVSDMLDAVTGA